MTKFDKYWRREYVAKNRDRIRAVSKAWYAAHGKAAAARKAEKTRSSPEARVRALVAKARNRAPSRGLEFGVVLEDFMPLPTVCPLLGVELCYNGPLSAVSPSLDRKDSSKGYVPGNVWVISHRANVIKNNATAEELATMARNLAAALNKGI